MGGAVLVAAAAVWPTRHRLFYLLRGSPALLLLVAAFGTALLWTDGGWRSSFYLASYAAVVLAAVTAGVRWALICATALAIGYVTGLVVNGYTWSELRALKDADSVVANTGGYFFAAAFFALPVSWLGGYVVRINQVLHDARPTPSGLAGQQPEPASQPSDVDGTATSITPLPSAAMVSPTSPRITDRLSVREAEVVHLVAEGLTNAEIAQRLVLSTRTAQNHVSNAMKKVGVRNRTELARIAIQEGLVPRG